MQLGYIGRYMRRPAIALHRIEGYDGQHVTFSYHDKTDGQKKQETVTVEEFISRIIRHIPDEQFKTIRHYGVYSRRIKAVCKRLITAWQKEVRKWIVKVKRTLTRRNWRQRIKEQTGKDPMVCPHCKNYYEYKGEVCLEDGILKIKYASSPTAERCLERMISDLTGIKTPQTREKEKIIQKPSGPRYRQLYMFGM